jgi:hypothetical protein
VSSSHPDRDAALARNVGRILTKLKVVRRPTGGGTLLTEPVIVARGSRVQMSTRGPGFPGSLALFDQEGRKLGEVMPMVRTGGGSLVPIVRTNGSTSDRVKRATEEHKLWGQEPVYQLRDVDDRRVLTVRQPNVRRADRDARSQGLASPVGAWWEVFGPDDGERAHPTPQGRAGSKHDRSARDDPGTCDPLNATPAAPDAGCKL